MPVDAPLLIVLAEDVELSTWCNSRADKVEARRLQLASRNMPVTAAELCEALETLEVLLRRIGGRELLAGHFGATEPTELP